MTLNLNATYKSESVTGFITIEQQGFITNTLLKGQIGSTNLLSQNYVALNSSYVTESLVGKTYVELLGTHSFIPSSNTPDYVTTGLMLHLDAEDSGSQLWGDVNPNVSGNPSQANRPLWQSLDNYDPGTTYTVLPLGGTGTPLIAGGTEIELTGSLAAIFANGPLYDITGSAKYLGLDGTDDFIQATGGVVKYLSPDPDSSEATAAIYRFQNLNTSSIEIWLASDRNRDNNVEEEILMTSFSRHVRLTKKGTSGRDLRVNIEGSTTNYSNTINNFFPPLTTGNPGPWMHLVVTIDGANNTVKVYKNGSLTNTFSSLNIDTTATLLYNPLVRIGTYTSQYFKGKIAIVRMYDFALSANQVTQNYNAELDRFE